MKSKQVTLMRIPKFLCKYTHLQGFSGGTQSQETQVQVLGQEDPLEQEMVTNSVILAWENPMDRGPWQAIAYRGFKELETTL